MKELPGALFIIDTKKEAIAVAEAKRLGIPVIAVVDTNCDLTDITYPIPGNDDAIRAISLFVEIIANAVVDAETRSASRSSRPSVMRMRPRPPSKSRKRMRRLSSPPMMRPTTPPSRLLRRRLWRALKRGKRTTPSMKRPYSKTKE